MGEIHSSLRVWNSRLNLVLAPLRDWDSIEGVGVFLNWFNLLRNCSFSECLVLEYLPIGVSSVSVGALHQLVLFPIGKRKNQHFEVTLAFIIPAPNQHLLRQKFPRCWADERSYLWSHFSGLCDSSFQLCFQCHCRHSCFRTRINWINFSFVFP